MRSVMPTPMENVVTSLDPRDSILAAWSILRYSGTGINTVISPVQYFQIGCQIDNRSIDTVYCIAEKTFDDDGRTYCRTVQPVGNGVIPPGKGKKIVVEIIPAAVIDSQVYRSGGVICRVEQDDIIDSCLVKAALALLFVLVEVL